MLDVCVMLKTYGGDAAYAYRLVASYNKFNQESLTLFIVVPEADMPLFIELESSTVVLLTDEQIPLRYLPDDGNQVKNLGFLNAGVAKLGFWELNLCRNYFAVDSDMVFIRPFGRSDFIDSEHRPLVVSTEATELRIDPFYYSRYWQHREESLRKISHHLGVSDERYASYHTVQIMNSRILKGFKEQFLEPRHWTYADALTVSLWEFFWYTTWALHQKDVPVSRSDEIVKVVHHQGEHLALQSLGVSEADLARGYIGVIVNSNWSRQYGLVDFDNPPRDKYLSEGAWAEWTKREGRKG